jgi:predicted DNA-binding transcriptional regulator AlpA
VPNDFLDTKGLGTEFGVMPQTIYNWRTQGRAPRAHKIGRKLFFSRADIERWLESRAEPDQRAAERVSE